MNGAMRLRETIRVVIADDRPLIRAGIRVLLERVPGVDVVGEAADGRAALEIIDQCTPDIVFMEVGMEGMNGLEAARRTRKSFPYVHVIMLSMRSNDEYVSQALRAGVSGYMLKTAMPAELSVAINAVMSGARYFSPVISQRMVEAYVNSGRDDDDVGKGMLTPRQREVLQLVAQGCSNKEIARKLALGVPTIETHRTELMQRLDIHNVAGLVRYAVGCGLVSADQ
jgi:DNA-binding NarL/FixJ family response regulator